ncbi:MAG TPA: PucR family transcriptional regulator ligand-binding domain-containing protein, partial [Chloroflexia bacterium]|nr:PucR family transcriptional regulator ligand-binding domain-containing protein [Chloroflexia bacterium]
MNRTLAVDPRPAPALITVADVLHSVLGGDGGATVLGGAAGLRHEATWPVLARPTSPIFPTLKAGDIALATAHALRELDPPADLALLIDGLAERGAAALIMRGPLRPGEQAVAVHAAEAHGIPLLLTDEDAHLNELERAITALVRERRDAFYARTAHLQELQLQLTEAAPGRGGPGLERVVQTLADLTDVAAALTGPAPAFAIRHVAQPGPAMDGRMSSAAVERAGFPPLAGLLSAWQAPGTFVGARAAEPPVLMVETGLLAAPVLVRERVAGALLLAARPAASEIDRLTLARAAGICALEWARSHAVAAAETRTEQRLRGAFLTDLLNHVPGSGEEALLSRALALGIDL